MAQLFDGVLARSAKRKRISGKFNPWKAARAAVVVFILVDAAALLILPHVGASPSLSESQSNPRVISTYPTNGADNVSPGVIELAVEFDQDMSTNSYSWSKGGKLFPESVGTPRWVSKRKCVVTAELEKNSVYTIGVNGFNLNGFHDTTGTPAATHVFSFRTASSDAERIPFREEQANVRAFDALKTAVLERYSYRDLRGIDWNARFDGFRERFLQCRTADELVFHVADVLSAAHDPHIWVDHGPARFPTMQREVTPNFSGDVLSQAVEGLTKVNETIYTGEYADGIVYVLITSWANERTKGIGELAKVLDDVRDAPAIILDVRPNSGGNDLYCEAVARRFAAESFVYQKVRSIDANAPSGFMETRERTIEPLRGGPLFSGRVAVLMGPMNMSSCESFLLMMQPLSNARLFGQTSYGSSGNPQPHELGAGVSVHLPSWQAMTPRGELLEGHGVTPDVVVETEPEDFADSDPVITAALDWLREND